jgi:alkylation response protein AidB-like acyl-CoA dehydrogenase
MASATKARVAQAGRFVTGQAIQLHGGIGVAEEYPLGRHFRRLLAFDLRHGAAAAHVARFAGLPQSG